MTDPTAALDYHVVIVRWDDEQCRVVVDLGGVDCLSAYTMLCQASEAVYDYIDEPLVISDENREVRNDESE